VEHQAAFGGIDSGRQAPSANFYDSVRARPHFWSMRSLTRYRRDRTLKIRSGSDELV
jgi:hypothetical protein